MSRMIEHLGNESYRIEDVNDVTEYIYRFILIKFIGYIFTFVFIILIACIRANILIVGIPSLIADSIILIILFSYQIKTSKYLLTFAIIECFFDIIFKIFVIICTRNDYSKIYSLSIAVIHLLLNFLSCKDHSKALFLPQIFFTNILFYLFTLFLFLRIDDIISWKLDVCFWPGYIYLGMIFLFGIFRLKEFLILTKKLSCTNLLIKKYLRKNFEFFTSVIFLSTHITSIYLITTSENNKLISNTELNPLLIKSSIPLLICFFIESFYLLLCKNKIRKYLKNFIFFLNRNLVNVGDDVHIGIETNEVLHTEQHIPQSPSDSNSNDFRNENNNRIPEGEKVEIKNMLKNYIKHYLPNHLIKKTSCYYVPGLKDKKTKNYLSVNPIRVSRRVISQTVFKNVKDKNNLANLTPIKKSQRTSSLNNVDSIETENEKRIDKNKCLMCCENEQNAVFMNCGHGGMCYTCCIKLWKNGDECHICRGKISEVLQIVEDLKNKGKFSIVSATFTLDSERINKFKEDYENEMLNKKNDSEKNSSEDRDVNLELLKKKVK